MSCDAAGAYSCLQYCLPSLQMMENLLLQEGDVVTLRSATLPKGTFVKLQVGMGRDCRVDGLLWLCRRYALAGWLLALGQPACAAAGPVQLHVCVQGCSRSAPNAVPCLSVCSRTPPTFWTSPPR